MYRCLHVKYPLFLSDFKETQNFSTNFRNMLKYQISYKSVNREPSSAMRTEGQRHDEANIRISTFCEGA
jgi:hypothetical protein